MDATVRDYNRNRILIGLNFESASRANTRANTWERALTWNVPTGYSWEPVWFLSMNNNTIAQSKFTREIDFGTFNTSTGVFTDGDALTSPLFFTELDAFMTADITGGSTTVTVTYVNQDGTGGRSATATLTTASDIGQYWSFTLQSGDIGIQNVTAVSCTPARTGAFTLIGSQELAYYDTEAAWKVNEKSWSAGSVVIPSGIGGRVVFKYLSDSTSAVLRYMKALGGLYLTT